MVCIIVKYKLSSIFFIIRPHFFCISSYIILQTSSCLIILTLLNKTLKKRLKDIFSFYFVHILLLCFYSDCKRKSCAFGGDSLSTFSSIGVRECRKNCQEHPYCQLWIVSSGNCHFKTFEDLISFNPKCDTSAARAVSGTSLCPGKLLNLSIEL
jgi:hypothetical protein